MPVYREETGKFGGGAGDGSGSGLGDGRTCRYTICLLGFPTYGYGRGSGGIDGSGPYWETDRCGGTGVPVTMYKVGT